MSLSGTHAPVRHARTSECICLGFPYRCLGAPHARSIHHMWGERLLGWCLMCCGSWIMHANAPRARAALHTRGMPAPTLTSTGGKRLLGGCPMGCGSCMHVHHTYIHTHACTEHIHVHAMLTHAHSCCMLITCTHTHIHACMNMHTCLVTCSSHTHLHIYACNTHTHTHTHIHVYMHTCVTHPEATQHVGAAYIST